MSDYFDRTQRANSPRAAVLGLARALDELSARLDKLESADSWDTWGDDEPSAGEGIIAQHEDTGSIHTEQREGELIYDLPTPSEEKLEQRRMLERQQLKLALVLGEDADPNVDWAEVYAKGGPWWLYQHRRDIVMSYDHHVRRMMVTDLEEDSPKLAYEMALDILKQPAGEPDLENGSGALAVGLVDGKPKGRR